MNSPQKVFVNGQPSASIDVTDRGLQYGDGVFRTLLVSDGQIVDETLQLEKLSSDARVLGLPGIDKSQWLKDISTLIHSASGEAVLKLIWTRGKGTRGYRAPEAEEATRIVSLYPLAQQPHEYWTDGVDLFLCNTRLGHNPGLAGIKHLNRLEQVLASREFDSAYQDGLMMDIKSHVISGTMSNLFLVDNGTLITPSLDMCGIDGVIRNKIIQLAEGLGIKFTSRSIHIENVTTAEEVFLCNSLIGIWPVKSFQDKQWSPGTLTRVLQNKLQHPRIPK